MFYAGETIRVKGRFREHWRRRDAAARRPRRIATDYPNSFAALAIRAQIAQARGRTASALAQYRRAPDILERNQDRQHVTTVGSLERDAQIDGLKTLIRGLEGR